MGSIDRRLERLEALYACLEPSGICLMVLDRAFARVSDQAMDCIYDALARDAFGDAERSNLVELPYELLTPEEVEALERLPEALEEELDTT
jgi:hypothetical protein